MISSVSELVRIARNGLSQEQFAKELGVKQSSISRYEKGLVNPPARVIDHCLRLINQNQTNIAPSAEELASKILNHLTDIAAAETRMALDKIIDTLVAKQSNIKSKKGKR
ncbi:helix-turn-helix transcriptional regulator [Methylomicrobium agile]|uniref:helix-turn-helix transcriptional regulator n=1 Tax=Methylomicrobium agile TaxID=39774 RepID=UPI00056307B3|nr:helix-turn-helix transcriptional regulator [Methylomicrobium agile]